MPILQMQAGFRAQRDKNCPKIALLVLLFQILDYETGSEHKIQGLSTVIPTPKFLSNFLLHTVETGLPPTHYEHSGINGCFESPLSVLGVYN